MTLSGEQQPPRTERPRPGQEDDDVLGEELEGLYDERFAEEARSRDELWQVLCRDFFQHWVPSDATVLDVGAGHCEFVNNIRAGRRLAVDLSPALPRWADDGVEARVGPADRLDWLDDESVDRVFVSNFFEHVTRAQILAILRETRRVLRPDGKLLVLQPNIRYCARDYWMFFDHITPVDDRALAEAFAATGFDVEHCVPRFLPYTTKGKVPSRPFLVRAYLRVPLVWRLLGGQAFMVGSPRVGSGA